jgi:trimeric autotransporter adhesin
MAVLLQFPSGADTFATLAATQTLTNKTLTAPVISTISNTGTLTLPTSTDTLVGRATTDTLTNKTLTAPVISSITNGGCHTNSTNNY